MGISTQEIGTDPLPPDLRSIDEPKSPEKTPKVAATPAQSDGASRLAARELAAGDLSGAYSIYRALK